MSGEYINAVLSACALHVQKLYHQKQHEGLSAQMIVQIHKVLRMALNDAIMLNHLSRNICQAVQVPRYSRKSEMHPLTAEQARQFLAALQGDSLEAFYVLALTTGMRRGELLGLKWSHVDLETGKIQVCQFLTRLPRQGLVMTELKTQASRRCIQLTSQAIEALKRHHQRQIEGVSARRRNCIAQFWNAPLR